MNLRHVPAELSGEARAELLAAQGREAVIRHGCARCHREAFGIVDPPPGPWLADVGERIDRSWMLRWLADPKALRPGARMPALFAADRNGFVERFIVADWLQRTTGTSVPASREVTGDHRPGRQEFIGLGCAACHPLPDGDPVSPPDPKRAAFEGLIDRTTQRHLALFLANPLVRYPDGRMPRFPVTPQTARDLAAYLLIYSRAAVLDLEEASTPTSDEIEAVAGKLGVQGIDAAAAALVRVKGCARCHPGLGDSIPASVAIGALAHEWSAERGCLSGRTLPRFDLDADTLSAIRAYLRVAGEEQHSSEFEDRRRMLLRQGCERCHARDGGTAAPLEEIGQRLWTPMLYRVPYQKVPSLNNAWRKYTREYLRAAIAEGVSGARPSWYSYRMPAFGDEADSILRALCEADGDLWDLAESVSVDEQDPTLFTVGTTLVGFEGYSCVSCHLWNGQNLTEADPGSIGPELTSVTRRIRREWFDQFLENPLRLHPGTPMPSFFPRGEPARFTSVLEGDPSRQKDAIWAYLSRGKDAPSPRPRPPIPITVPAEGKPLVAQIPIQLPDRTVLESICVLFRNGDLLLYDVENLAPHNVYTGARILRSPQGLGRRYLLEGQPVTTSFRVDQSSMLENQHGREKPISLTLQGFDRVEGGVRIRSRLSFPSGSAERVEMFSIEGEDSHRRLRQEVEMGGISPGSVLELSSRVPDSSRAQGEWEWIRIEGQSDGALKDGIFTARLWLGAGSRISGGALCLKLPPPQAPAEPAAALEATFSSLEDGTYVEGSLERPGYRAIRFPRPQTSSGEDGVMPVALAADPESGRLFVASVKLGEIFVLDDSGDDGKDARFVDYAHGLFQDAYSMLHDGEALYVLHRKNLTRVVDTDGDGHADRFDRIATFPHAVADAYDWAYGLVRDRAGDFILSLAPHANHHLKGSGSVLRLRPGESATLEEVTFGLRNPLGWCAGPEGEVFFTDNQGEWVAANKLCHLMEGRFYGYPNPAQRLHIEKPKAPAAIWVPYEWARSINGVTFDRTQGRFGPFAGQFFLAELMNGGAIVRANVERVNGVYQGACFPFWGKGLLGPLALTFDPGGRLFVGGITQPGWMGQPDRGCLYRIDFTGEMPFEIQSIHARPQGFRLVFTTPVAVEFAADPTSYTIEHHRYEYTGAYGSPELERTNLPIERVDLSSDLRTVDLSTEPLVKDRVYTISASGVRSTGGAAPLFSTGAYTLNEIPLH